jgi:uncharacterized membrane protein
VRSFLARPAGRWLLLGSLALNLVLLPAVLLPWFGVGITPEPPAEHRQRRSLPSPWALRAALDEDGRERFNLVMERHRPMMRAAIREVRGSRREVDAAIRAEPFDGSALEQALSGLRRHEAAATAAVHALLVEAIAELDRSQRTALAEQLWRGGGDRTGRRGEWRERRDSEQRERDGRRPD